MNLCRATTLLSLILCLCACDAKSVCAPAALGPPDKPPAFAVVTSDRSSTAIALLDESAALITEAWIDSGTTAANISATLSGDVVLASHPFARGEVAVIDRLGVDVLTRIEIATGTVLHQYQTERLDDSSSTSSQFRANPYDALLWSDDTIFVSRFSANLMMNSSSADNGSDLIRIHKSDGSLVARIGFDAFETTGPNGPYYARPALMVKRGDRLAVGLAELDSQFLTGPGAVGVVDPATNTATTLALTGLRNCGEIVESPADDTHAFVLCSGYSFSLEGDRRAAAGIALINIPASGNAVIEHIWRASDHATSRVPSNGLVVIDATRVAVNAMGDQSANTNDAYVVIDFSDDSQMTAFTSEGAFVNGIGAFVDATKMIYVPDANAGLHVGHLNANGTIDMLNTINVSPCRHLPAREIRPISR